MREIGHGVYGLAYSHSVRFDKYDNLWVVDKATMSVMKFDPEGIVLMNLGRRDEGPDEPRYRHADPPPTPVEAISTGRPTSPGIRTTTSTSATATSTRKSPSSTSMATGSSDGARPARAENTPTKIPASSAILTTSGSTARETSMWPTAATGAFRCSTPMAISRNSSSSTCLMTRRAIPF